MSTFPNQLANRAAATIAKTARLVTVAHVRLNTLGSQVSALTPGDWELLTLEAGWTSLPGYIPAQVRILQNGMSQLVGHIEGGTVTNGTVIGTLTSGYYNAVHAHSFTANVLAGAAAVSVAGAVSGATDSNALSNGSTSGTSADSGIADGTVGGSTNTVGLPDGTIGGSSAAAAGPGSHSHAGGSYAVNNGQHSHTVSGAVANGHHTHGAGSFGVTNSNHVHTNVSGNQASATPVNYNTVILTLSTSGVLTITNCSAAATQISFNETLPLITS